MKTTYVYAVTDTNGKQLFIGEREQAYAFAAQGKLLTVTPHQVAACKDIPKGEYVKRKADSKKVYIRGDYVPSLKQYELTDCDDVNRVIYVKGSTMLYVGFTY